MKRRSAVLALLGSATLVSATLVSAGLAAQAGAAPAAPALSGRIVEYNVLLTDGASMSSAVKAVHAAGGTVTRPNKAVGLLTVRAPQNGFTARVGSARSIDTAARSRQIGHAPRGDAARKRNAVEKERATQSAAQKHRKGSTAGLDPLDDQLWGLKSVRSDLARTVQAGSHRVLVGIIDTGVDGSHPDIAPNFNATLSRNFTQDIPTDPNGVVLDGPCEFRGCVDPADHDDNGHGTHVAGTIAAAANGLGVSGVAPKVTIVNDRAGQDSGYFFLQPTVDALTYAGDAGLDVVNMSFYVDPWLFNCSNNPADNPEEQAQQRIVNKAMTRALNYAYQHGVTAVAALGNEHEDLDNPLPDSSSPDYPINTAHPRDIDPATCLSMPLEGPNVIGVSSYGPSRTKADYSNYGGPVSVSAPGGYFRDYFGTDRYRTNENLILSAYPKNVAIAEGAVDPATGDVTPHGASLGVQKDCQDGVCGYYQFLQGTSMASPHATGVAALIVSQYGHRSAHGGFTMSPKAVRRVLEGTAFEISCPVPPTVDYTPTGRSPEFNATCTGTPQYNSFYGHGSVDAYAAVTHGKKYLT